jgi:hypothetical protein
MFYWKDKLSDVIAVLTNMRNDLKRNANYRNTTELRKDAVNKFAESEFRAGRYKNLDSARKTVHDACARRLRPDVQDIGSFDELADQWLRNRSMKLIDILVEHSGGGLIVQKLFEFFSNKD